MSKARIPKLYRIDAYVIERQHPPKLVSNGKSHRTDIYTQRCCGCFPRTYRLVYSVPDCDGIRGYGSGGLFSYSALVDCRFAFCSIVDQLSGSRRYFIRTAIHFQRFPTHIARQGPAALFLFLVICADANPDRLERGPIQFALALCRSVHHLVIRTRPNGLGQQPFGGSENPFTCPEERKSSACCLHRKNVVCPLDFSTSGLEPDWCSKASSFLGS